MLSYGELETAALKYVAESKMEFFDAEELAAELDPQVGEKERDTVLRRLCGILDSCEFVARKHSSELYYILDNFFRGTLFYCKPREIELEQGILIPGARFEVFHPEELYPTELEIFTKNAKNPFELTSVKLAYEDIADLYFMLGPAGTMDMLTAESQDNYEKLRRAGGLRPEMEMELEAFDFSEFYRNTDFRSGDMLKFEIASWGDGKMTVSRVSRVDAPSPREINTWIDKFEAALTDVCFDYKDSFDIHEQLMHAYVYAAASGNDVCKTPGPAIDLYHTMMQTVSFRRDGNDWIIISNDQMEDAASAPSPQKPQPEHEHAHGETCSCGHAHDHESAKANEDPFGDLAPEDFTVSQGSLDSIDAILTEIHAPVCETELQAYMLDTIANGAETYSEFERVHENIVKFSFADDAQEAAFLNLTEDLWDRTFEHYSHNLDSSKAPLRARLLELSDNRIELSSAVSAYKNNRFPEELQKKLDAVHANIIETQFILNRDSVLEEDELENLELRVGDIEDEYELVSEKAMEWVEKQITDGK